MNSGLLPSIIVSFATIANPAKGKPIKNQRQFLDKVHMDIVFGDCLALGGHRYAQLLVMYLQDTVGSMVCHHYHPRR